MAGAGHDQGLGAVSRAWHELARCVEGRRAAYRLGCRAQRERDPGPGARVDAEDFAAGSHPGTARDRLPTRGWQLDDRALVRPGGGEVGVHGDDTVDALAEAHDHRDETRFRDVTPQGADPVPDLDRDGALF